MPIKDLQTPWTGYPAPMPDMGGAGVVSRGSDPNAEGGEGAQGLTPIWPDPIHGAQGNAETPNSVSGLPSLPNRFEPSGTPPMPPDLTDRNPGTIDER